MQSCLKHTSLGFLINELQHLKHKNRLYLGDRVDCVFWDFTRNKWSSEGCRLIEMDSDRETTVCECNHLTNFAALMDTSGRETDDYMKNVVTQLLDIITKTSKQYMDFYRSRSDSNGSEYYFHRIPNP
ncbi:unnamed protein product [Oppiella nova]|uniref:GAIN-B domain-containing protein n=1 Tax=Oppiella nova TaxID=334625 RepID=A0A7R9QC73_9ACAR|nr:unnamed protein product [Oppiella nova]CAG2163003.1 unnamed protein product [Oppiella nova]